MKNAADPKMKWRKPVLIISGLVLLYILSVGPVVGTLAQAPERNSPILVGVVLVIYSPLIFTVDRIPALKRAFHWYAGLFGSPDQDEEESDSN